MEGVVKEHLMKGMMELMTKQQSGGKKLNMIAGNAERGKKMGSQVENENAKWRESLKLALIVVYEETMGMGNKQLTWQNKPTKILERLR